MAKLELMQDVLAPIREFAKGGGGKMKQNDIDRLIQAQVEANRVNQATPTGSLTFTGPNPAAGIQANTAITTLSPEEQAILEQSQIGRLLAGQTGLGRFADLGTGRADVERASFDRIANLLRPEFARREDQLRQRLSNQGLPQSSGAFTRELSRFDDSFARSMEQAALEATLAGGAEESRITANILSLLGLGQPVAPQFINVPQVEVPYSQQQQGASPLPGLLGLAGLAAGPMTGTGVAGSQLGFTAGSSLPALFGVR